MALLKDPHGCVLNNMSVVMTRHYLREHCKQERMKKNDLYATPSLNDKLYLHYKGFRKIESLEEYTSLKVIWLEGNGIDEIGGLENQTMLRTLYLHENCISKMQGLSALTDLDTLNLCKNFIQKIEGLESCQKLQTLLVAHNHLQTADDIRHVLKVPSLVSIDLQHNRIEDVAVLDILADMPDLRVVYLMGNPVVKKIRYYRKTVIAACSRLTYLDDRPVFEEERRRVTRWKVAFDTTGDYDKANEAERDEIKVIREEKRENDERNFRNFDRMMKEGLEERKRRESENAAAASSESGSSEISLTCDGEPVAKFPENPILKTQREARLAKLMGNETSSDRDKNMTTSEGFFSAGAAPAASAPGASYGDRSEKEAREASAREQLKSLLSQDIWPEQLDGSSHPAAKGVAPTESPPTVLAMPPPPPPADTEKSGAQANFERSMPRPPPVPNTDFDELD